MTELRQSITEATSHEDAPGRPSAAPRGRAGARVSLRGVAVCLVIALPLLTADTARQYLLGYMAIICLLALALHLVMGLAGIFSLGQAAFFGTGAYAGVVLMNNIGLDGMIALPLVAVIGGLLGVLMALVTLRVTELYLALTTLAFGYIGENIVRNSEYLGGASGLSGFELNLLGMRLDEPLILYWTGLFFVLLSIFVISSIRRSKVGRAMMACRESPVAAKSIGIDPRRYRILGLGLSGAMAAVAGSLYTAYAFVSDPAVFGLELTLAVLTVAIVGGLRSMPGVIISAIVLSYFRNSVETLGTNISVLLIYGLCVVLTLRFLPQGVGGALTSLVKGPNGVTARLRGGLRPGGGRA